MDAGNFSLPFGKEATLKNEFLIKAFVAMGYSAVNLGKADLRRGVRFILNLQERYRVPFVSTNLVYAETGAPVVATHLIKVLPTAERDLSVGILGVCPPQSKLFPQSLGEPQVSSLDPKTEVAREMRRVRSRCDLVVLLSQLSYAENRQLVESIEGIDVVIGAGDSVRVMETRGKVVLAATGMEGKYLGYMRVVPVRGGFRVAEQRLIALDERLGEDPAIKALESEFENTLKLHGE